MHRQLVRQQVPAAGRLDGIDVADDIRDGDVRRGELFNEPQLARQPRDRRLLAALGDQLAAVLRNRLERIIVDLAACENRDLLVEQRHELAENAALRLAAQAEQDEVVTREDRVDELGNHRLFVTHNAGKQRRAVLEQADQVFPHFVFYGALAAGRAGPLRALQLTECRRLCHGSTLNPSARALQPLRDPPYGRQQRPEHVVVRPAGGPPPLQQIDL